MTELTESKTNKPDVTLDGIDGNAFAILGVVRKAFKRQKFSQESLDSFMQDAQSGDYNNLFQAVFRHCNVVG